MKKQLFVAFILLFLTNMGIQAQTIKEFAPAGAEWYYTESMFVGQGYMECQHHVSEKDTLIDGRLCKVVRNVFPDHLAETVIFLQEENKIYHYFENQFHLLYDFDANIGDTLIFGFKKSERGEAPFEIMPMECVVNDVDFVQINGEMLKMISTTVLNEWVYGLTGLGSYNYVEKIGHPNVFMEKFQVSRPDATFVREMRCYHDDLLNYETEWWQQFDLPCNHTGPLSIRNVNEDDQVEIYPNPVFATLNVEANFSYDYFIFDINGKALCAGKGEPSRHAVDVSFLSKGIYLLQIQHANGNVSHHKIVKGDGR